MACPLDWDHVWTEFATDDGGWGVHDAPARNFCARLDEGIGAWTRVLVVSADPSLCADATSAYLDISPAGRSDAVHAAEKRRRERGWARLAPGRARLWNQ